MISFLKEAGNRIKSDTPKFFKYIRNVSVSLAGICGSMVMAYSSLPQAMVDLIPVWLLKSISFVSLGSAFVSQLTKSVPNEEKKEEVK